MPGESGCRMCGERSERERRTPKLAKSDRRGFCVCGSQPCWRIESALADAIVFSSFVVICRTADSINNVKHKSAGVN